MDELELLKEKELIEVAQKTEQKKKLKTENDHINSEQKLAKKKTLAINPAPETIKKESVVRSSLKQDEFANLGEQDENMVFAQAVLSPTAALLADYQTLTERKKRFFSDSFSMGLVKDSMDAFQSLLPKNGKPDARLKLRQKMALIEVADACRRYKKDKFANNGTKAKNKRHEAVEAILLHAEELLAGEYGNVSDDSVMRAQHEKVEAVVNRLASDKSSDVIISEYDSTAYEMESVIKPGADFSTSKQKIIFKQKHLLAKVDAYLKSHASNSVEGRKNYEKYHTLRRQIEWEIDKISKITENDLINTGSRTLTWADFVREESILLTKNNENEVVTEHMEKKTFHENGEMNICVSALAAYLGADIYARHRKAQLSVENENKNGSISSAVPGAETYRFIVDLAKSKNKEIIYSDRALLELNRMALFDYLLGVDQRTQDDFRYEITESTFEGRDVVRIDHISAAQSTGAFSDKKADPEKPFSLPVYDRGFSEMLVHTQADELIVQAQRSGITLSDAQKDAFASRHAHLLNVLTKDIAEYSLLSEDEKKKTDQQTRVAKGIRRRIDNKENAFPYIEKTFVAVRDLKKTVAQRDSETDADLLRLNRVSDEKSKSHQTTQDHKAFLGEVAAFLKEKYDKLKLPEKLKTDMDSLAENLKEYADFHLLGQDNEKIDNQIIKSYVPDPGKAVTEAMIYITDSNGKKVFSPDKVEQLIASGTLAYLSSSNELSKENRLLSQVMSMIGSCLSQAQGLAGDQSLLSEEERQDMIEDLTVLSSQFKFTAGELEIPAPEPVQNAKTGKKKSSSPKFRVIKSTDQNNDFYSTSHETREIVVHGKKATKKVNRLTELKMTDVKSLPLFAHEPCMEDVAQGGLGDCYLLAGLAAIVEADPKHITGMMKDNGDTVTVRLYDKKQKPVYVTVDKTIPDELKRVTVGKDYIHAGSRYSRGALWVMMIEKAVLISGLIQEHDDLQQLTADSKTDEKERLKLELLQELEKKSANGKKARSYNTIAGMPVATAFKLFMGKSDTFVVSNEFDIDMEIKNAQIYSGVSKEEALKRYYQKNTPVAMKKLKEYLDSKKPVVAGTKKINDGESDGLAGEKSRGGMYGNHAYTVLGIEQIGGKEYVKLRNPWGSGRIFYEKQKGTEVIIPRKSATDDTGPFYVTAELFGQLFDAVASI